MPRYDDYGRPYTLSAYSGSSRRPSDTGSYRSTHTHSSQRTDHSRHSNHSHHYDHSDYANGSYYDTYRDSSTSSASYRRYGDYGRPVGFVSRTPPRTYSPIFSRSPSPVRNRSGSGYQTTTRSRGTARSRTPSPVSPLTRDDRYSPPLRANLAAQPPDRYPRTDNYYDSVRYLDRGFVNASRLRTPPRTTSPPPRFLSDDLFDPPAHVRTTSFESTYSPRTGDGSANNYRIPSPRSGSRRRSFWD